MGALSVCAITWKPSGVRVRWSPWLIQTVAPSATPSSRPSVRSTRSAARPYSRRPLGFTSPPITCAIAWSP